MLVLASICIPARAASAESLSQTMQRCAPTIAVSTLDHVVTVESGWNPWAIHVNGTRQLARQPVNREDAIRIAQWLLDQGHDIDLGLGQINVRNLRRIHLTLADAFDACKNLSAAADLLSTGLKLALSGGVQQPVLTALSYYNTGSPTLGFRNGYVDSVLKTRGATPIPLLPSVIPAFALDAFASDSNVGVYQSARR